MAVSNRIIHYLYLSLLILVSFCSPVNAASNQQDDADLVASIASGDIKAPKINSYLSDDDINAEESIDPFTGKLRLAQLDLLIQGNGGLDIEIKRSCFNEAADLIWGIFPSWRFGFYGSADFGIESDVDSFTFTIDARTQVFVKNNGNLDAHPSPFQFMSQEGWVANYINGHDRGGGVYIWSPRLKEPVTKRCLDAILSM